MAKEAPNYIWGVGRRKTSVARVRVIEGSGKIEVNGRKVDDYFSEEKHRADVVKPLEVTSTGGNLDVFIRVTGGGFAGQSGACVLGIARALAKHDANHYQVLREHHLLTRDGRMKERKKYGQKGARKKFQFSKR
ncbi:30S ribosomal protein S9 [Planctomycetes bacterium Pan216]|uniref:Small ribosomal subunit protein uS9 n=1 Tax=Kolteria novifilia TaxID=2527975 RepID=A0A518BAY2_9BACT|nr:30S ribosomal protein S9 [Planctomycetes bacterium Pan216]